MMQPRRIIFSSVISFHVFSMWNKFTFFSFHYFSIAEHLCIALVLQCFYSLVMHLTQVNINKIDIIFCVISFRHLFKTLSVMMLYFNAYLECHFTQTYWCFIDNLKKLCFLNLTSLLFERQTVNDDLAEIRRTYIRTVCSGRVFERAKIWKKRKKAKMLVKERANLCIGHVRCLHIAIFVHSAYFMSTLHFVNNKVKSVF